MAYASVWDAVQYTAAAEEASELRIQSVLDDAAEYVARMAPRLAPRQLTLQEAMTSTSGVIQLGSVTATDPLNLYQLTTSAKHFPAAGVVQIDNEHIGYAYQDPTLNQFSGLRRGYGHTTAASHLAGAAIIDATYEYRAKRAELRVFDYLWLTGGNTLSSSSFLGSSASYVPDTTIRRIVREVMGKYAIGQGPVNIS